MHRLSAQDATFLSLEGPTTQMHIGGMLLFEGPAPDFTDIRNTIDAKLDRVPRYRQRPVSPPRLVDVRPMWIDDPYFSLDYHVRHTALPAPGSDEQLERAVSDIFSRQLDTTRPLWEFWVIEGLTDDRFAVVYKVHHALVDGVSGVDVLQMLLDPMPREPSPPRAVPYSAPPAPSAVEIAVRAAVERTIGSPRRIAGGLLAALRVPSETAREAVTRAKGLGEVAWAFIDRAPQSPINGPDGPNRVVAWTIDSLADLKLAKNTFGGTVNDVVLAATAGGLRALYESRNLRTSGVGLRALVPVSVRTTDQAGALGNRVAAMVAPIPIHVEDPVERLRQVSVAMGDLKESAQAIGAQTLTSMTEVAPPSLFHQASRLQFSTRLFNLIVTNVPGPQIPLYLLDRKMLAGVPFAFLPAGHGLAVAIVSYCGTVGFGVLADRDRVPDAEIVADGIHRDLVALHAAAAAQSPLGAEPDDPPEPEPDAETQAAVESIPVANPNGRAKTPAP